MIWIMVIAFVVALLVVSLAYKLSSGAPETPMDRSCSNCAHMTYEGHDGFMYWGGMASMAMPMDPRKWRCKLTLRRDPVTGKRNMGGQLCCERNAGFKCKEHAPRKKLWWE